MLLAGGLLAAFGLRKRFNRRRGAGLA